MTTPVVVTKAITPVFKADEAKRLVYGVVLEPETEDTQGDILSKAEIEQAAHEYLKDFRVVGEQHSDVADAAPVESFIAPVDFQLGDQVVKAGSWVMAVKVQDQAMWEAVLKGEFTGFSIGGFGVRNPVE